MSKQQGRVQARAPHRPAGFAIPLVAHGLNNPIPLKSAAGRLSARVPTSACIRQTGLENENLH